ncbi:MAG: flagellar biosynthesis protein FlgA, partial [Actinobacteria bacterium]|nr:flagellar biosynthesis protein FlgA [Actinomycetota bacterium]
MVVVAGSVLIGARVIGAADDTVTVWAAAQELPAGAPLAADDLVAVRVRFADEADLAAYLPTSAELPAQAVLGRAVGAGEL